VIVVASLRGLASVVVWLRTKISWYSMRVVSQALRFCWILAFRARGDVIKRSLPTGSA
jgi:hypothetical protein